MPCQSDHYCDHTSINRELDLLTHLLCKMCETSKRLPKDVAAWWKEHQEWDRRRQAEESEEKRKAQVKRDAYKKLTKEERELLYLREVEE